MHGGKAGCSVSGVAMTTAVEVAVHARVQICLAVTALGMPCG